MRGTQNFQGAMFTDLSLVERVPAKHPLRKLRAVLNALLARMSSVFQAAYSKAGRPSVPPKMQLKALLLQILFTIRSERHLVESIDYKLPTAEHFSVKGTLIEAWASQKGFQRKDQDSPLPLGRNPEVNYQGERRSNGSHASRSDADARLYKKSEGDKSRLCHMAHILMDNRHGLISDVEVSHARQVAAKKAYSAIDGRTTRNASYKRSLRVRKRIEEALGWIKTVGGLAKTKPIGQAKHSGQVLLCFAAYHLVRKGLISGWWDSHHA